MGWILTLERWRESSMCCVWGLPCAVTEIINAYDTPDMIRIIKERFWLYDGNDYRKVREIYIYPDASGDSRKSSNASTTDIAQLKQAGF
ncbi:hypothetical protein HTS61_25690 [Escherichia coli]|nr:hypothetical protein [Escherichia coli]